ncbi:MAG: tandem-95 repeat protein, partial [Haliea sp.]
IDAQGQLRFIPEPNYSGPAAFTYWVADAAGAETSATVLLTISPVNDAPAVTNESLGGAEDTVYSFDPALLLANDLDIDGPSALSIVSVGGAQHGQVVLQAQPDGSQRIVFTPQANYFGAASFNYTVSDGAGGMSQGTVVLNLAEVNDAPVAMPDQQGGMEDAALHIPVSQLAGNDMDPDTLNSSIQSGAINDVLTIAGVGAVGNAVHGTVALGVDPATQAPEILFTPDADYFGPASFTYTVNDGRGGSSSTLVTLTIAPVNDAPVTIGETIASDEDAPLLIAPAALLANDLDIDNPHADLRISAVGAATHGTVFLQGDGTVAFTPEPDYFGMATFEYTVSDGDGGHTVAVATVQLANINDAPVLAGETVAGTEDTPLDIAAAALLANDSDIDSPHANLAITSVGNATHGAVVLQADGSIRFTPDANYNASHGPASFEYAVTDGDGGVTTGIATLNIAAVNDAPVVLGEVAAVANEDTALTFSPAALLSNDSDVDNLPSELSISAVGNATHGSVTLAADGSVTFTPELNHTGAASFTYTVSDGAGGLSEATVALEFASVNDAPSLANDTVAAVEDTPILISTASLLANDADVDTPHGQLAVTGVGNASHGTVVLEAGGNVRFTPDADFNGAAGFSYTVSDGAGGVSTATAQVQVGDVNDAPVALADPLAPQLEDTHLVIMASALLANDTDVD